MDLRLCVGFVFISIEFVVMEFEEEKGPYEIWDRLNTWKKDLKLICIIFIVVKIEFVIRMLLRLHKIVHTKNNVCKSWINLNQLIQ